MLFTVILLQGTFTLLVYAHAGRTNCINVDRKYAVSLCSTLYLRQVMQALAVMKRGNNLTNGKYSPFRVEFYAERLFRG